jgi:ketosteroid isomerase-like protein
MDNVTFLKDLYEAFGRGEIPTVLEALSPDEARYTGTYKATGRSLDAQVCHVWDVTGGKIARFPQYVDTAKVRHVMGAS